MGSWYTQLTIWPLKLLCSKAMQVTAARQIQALVLQLKKALAANLLQKLHLQRRLIANLLQKRRPLLLMSKSKPL